MTRKRFSEEAILGILRQIELDLAGGGAVEMAIRTASISDATYYKWRKRYDELETLSYQILQARCKVGLISDIRSKID